MREHAEAILALEYAETKHTHALAAVEAALAAVHASNAGAVYSFVGM